MSEDGHPAARTPDAGTAADAGTPSDAGSAPDAGQPPASAPQPWHYRLLHSKTWSRTTKIVTVAVTTIGLFTGIVGVIPILTKDATGFSSLRIEATPYEDAAPEYAVPLAVLVDLPEEAASSCGSGDGGWLAENGTVLARRLILDMRNTASEGSMLALADFRTSEGEGPGDPVEQTDELVRVVCGTPDAGLLRSARIDLGEAGATAVFARDAFGDGGPENAPDVPVGWNLAPGETGKLVVDLYSGVPAGGSLEVTVLRGTEERTVAIEGSDFAVPGLRDAGRRYLALGEEGWVCVTLTPGATCTVEELLGAGDATG